MKVRNVRAVGAIVRERRRELGMDQQSLASRIGASRYWVVQMEQGNEGAEIGRVLRVLEALGLEVGVSRDAGSGKFMGSKEKEDRIPVIDINAIVERARRVPVIEGIRPATKKSSSVARRGK